MNNEENGYDQNEVKPYRATSNLNVLLSNPTYQSGNMVDSNINNSQVDNSMGTLTYNLESPQVMPEPVNVPESPVPEPPKVAHPVSDEKLDVTEKAYQEVPLEEARTIKNTTYISNMEMPKEKKKKTVKVSKDTLVIILMLFIIFVFIMALPSLSEMIREIRY